MLRFACPACNAVMEAPEQKVGRKINCLKCGQRLQIPPPLQRTILANPLPPPRSPEPVPPPVPQQSQHDPFVGIEEPEQPGDGPIIRRHRKRGRKLVFLMAFAILCCAAGGTWLFLRSGGGFHKSAGGEEQSKNPVLPRLQGNEEKLVQEHILRNADDSSSVEIAEWGEPRFVLIGGNRKASYRGEKEELVADKIEGYTPGVIMHLRWREKNRFGAKVLREGVFLIQEGRVVRAEAVGEGELRGYPHATALKWALGLLGPVAVERVEGKLTKVIVRGNVSRPGPISQGLWVSWSGEVGAGDGSLASDFEMIAREVWHKEHGRGGRSDLYAIHAVTTPPRYEISGVSPGTYLVTVEWGDGVKTTRSITVTDAREIQTFDFDLKAESIPGKHR